MSSGWVAHIVALVAALEVIVLVALVWGVNLSGGTPLVFDLGAILIVIPFALFLLFAMWLVLRFLLLRRIRWRAWLVLASALVLGYVLVAARCGPVACFQPEPFRFMGWYLVLGVAAAALAHHLALTSFQKKNPNGH